MDFAHKIRIRRMRILAGSVTSLAQTVTGTDMLCICNVYTDYKLQMHNVHVR